MLLTLMMCCFNNGGVAGDCHMLKKPAMTLRIRRTTKMSKLMGAYCTQQGVPRDDMAFVVGAQSADGWPAPLERQREVREVREADTPDLLGLEDGNCIDAHSKVLSLLQNVAELSDKTLLSQRDSLRAVLTKDWGHGLSPLDGQYPTP